MLKNRSTRQRNNADEKNEKQMKNVDKREIEKNAVKHIKLLKKETAAEEQRNKRFSKLNCFQ